MTAEKYTKALDFEQVRVRGGDLAELSRVIHYLNVGDNEGVTWHTEGDTLVFEWAMGSSLVGGKNYLEG